MSHTKVSLFLNVKVDSFIVQMQILIQNQIILTYLNIQINRLRFKAFYAPKKYIELCTMYILLYNKYLL